ncbi:MAG: hypothetical protein PHG82_00120 [Candidatus Gracilibacteria bacterium]|nr:hypothetical protein [Candidatus Gracilibacteria bacterium]
MKNLFTSLYLLGNSEASDENFLEILKQAKELGHDATECGNLALRTINEAYFPKSLHFLIYECGVNPCHYMHEGKYSDYAARDGLATYAKIMLGAIAPERYLEYCKVLFAHPNSKKWISDNFSSLDEYIRNFRKLDFDINKVLEL